jgi:hypothetical protein
MRLRGEENGKGAREKTLELSGIERRKEQGEDGLALAEAVVGVARECSRFKPSPEPRKVEGPGSRTKAKGGLVLRYGISSRIYPVERPEPVRKSWGRSISFTWITMVSVCRIRAFMRAQSLWGPDMKRDWSVKPSLAPRKVEGLSSIAMARLVTGKGTADRAKPPHSMEHHQSGVSTGGPRSRPEDLEGHHVHSDNHGSSVSDPRVSPENNANEEEDTDRGKACQRNEERVRRLNQGDIEVLGEYLPEVVGSVFDTAVQGPLDATVKADGYLLRAIECALRKETPVPRKPPFQFKMTPKPANTTLRC